MKREDPRNRSPLAALADLRTSRVILQGQESVVIENHAGLSGYTDACIQVKVSRGEIAVEGAGLQLAVLDPGLIEIRGRIQAVRLV